MQLPLHFFSFPLDGENTWRPPEGLIVRIRFNPPATSASVSYTLDLAAGEWEEMEAKELSLHQLTPTNPHPNQATSVNQAMS